jgi:uncharacterized protein YecE (DUF72 family)
MYRIKELRTRKYAFMNRVFVGTSGWHYAHWKGSFYPSTLPASEMLKWYSERFCTVEINNSFYRLPTDESVSNWKSQTPADFCFAVKASRYITHNRKLTDPENSMAKFIAMLKGFGRKLGPVLFQLPPAWKLNQERLKEFLQALPPGKHYVMEFRNPTWYTEPVYQLLREHNVALCISDLAGFLSPLEVTADFVYVRLHGPGNAYQGSYDAAALRRWATKIKQWTGESRSVYFYFDNDQAGYAAKNALALRRRLSPISA